MYSTEGLVLKKIDVGEVDALFSIYTRVFGKVRARAPGVKKEAAKLKGHLEPLNLSWVSFVLGRNGERFTQATSLTVWPTMRTHLVNLSAGWYVAEVTHQHCLEGERDDNLWGLLTESFEFLENHPLSVSARDTFLRQFDQRFLECLGYAGERDLRILGSLIAKPF